AVGQQVVLVEDLPGRAVGIRVERSNRKIADARAGLLAGPDADALPAREKGRTRGGVILVVAADLDLVVARIRRERPGVSLAERLVVHRRPEDVAEAAEDGEVRTGRVCRVVAELGHVEAERLRRVAVPVLGILEGE